MTIHHPAFALALVLYAGALGSILKWATTRHHHHDGNGRSPKADQEHHGGVK